MTKKDPGDSLNIGQVVERLKSAFPSVSISKLRYLEEEGLIKPYRSPGSYRKYSEDDVSRLEVILRLQQEHFLPLNVIRSKLRTLDTGGEVPELKSLSKPKKTVNLALPLEETELLSTKEVMKTTGLTPSELQELEEFGIIRPKETEKGNAFTSLDTKIAASAKELKNFGIEARHLKAHASFADREALMLQQILLPVSKHKDQESQKKAAIALSELLRLFKELQSLFLKKSLRNYFKNL